MSRFKGELAFNKAVLALLEKDGPKDGTGDLAGRWKTLAVQLRKDILKAERWLPDEEKTEVKDAQRSGDRSQVPL